MEQQHTPGKWHAEHLEPYWAITAQDGLDDIGYIRTEEDARLVVAAPMLLEALRLLVRFINPTESAMKAEARQAALAAIEAVEGRTLRTVSQADL